LLSAFSITWAIAHSPSHGFPGVGGPGLWVQPFTEPVSPVT
jgi:hypothetical protein